MAKSTHEPMNFKAMEQRNKSRRDRRTPSGSKVDRQRNRRGKAGLPANQYNDKAFNNIK